MVQEFKKDLSVSVSADVSKNAKVGKVVTAGATATVASVEMETTNNFTKYEWWIIVSVFVFSNIPGIVSLFYIMDKWVNFGFGLIVSGLSIFIGAKAIVKHRIITRSH